VSAVLLGIVINLLYLGIVFARLTVDQVLAAITGVEVVQ
jgi:hypothetical protein